MMSTADREPQKYADDVCQQCQEMSGVDHEDKLPRLLLKSRQPLESSWTSKCNAIQEVKSMLLLG